MNERVLALNNHTNVAVLTINAPETTRTRIFFVLDSSFFTASPLIAGRAVLPFLSCAEIVVVVVVVVIAPFVLLFVMDGDPDGIPFDMWGNGSGERGGGPPLCSPFVSSIFVTVVPSPSWPS